VVFVFPEHQDDSGGPKRITWGEEMIRSDAEDLKPVSPGWFKLFAGVEGVDVPGDHLDGPG